MPWTLRGTRHPLATVARAHINNLKAQEWNKAPSLLQQPHTARLEFARQHASACEFVRQHGLTIVWSKSAAAQETRTNHKDIHIHRAGHGDSFYR
jgi:hypothetical protein